MSDDKVRLSGYEFIEIGRYDIAFLNFFSLAQKSNLDTDWFFAGLAALALGGFSKAFEIYRDLSCRASDSPVNCSMYALLLAASPIDEHRNGLLATEITEHILSHFTSLSWEELSVCAAAYAEFGNFVEAIDLLQQAAQSCPLSFLDILKGRIAQYGEKKPLRLTEQQIRHYLSCFPKCVKCGRSTCVSRRLMCIECQERQSTGEGAGQ